MNLFVIANVVAALSLAAAQQNMLFGTCDSIGYSAACCPPSANCQAADGNCQCDADCHDSMFNDCCSDAHCSPRI